MVELLEGKGNRNNLSDAESKTAATNRIR